MSETSPLLVLFDGNALVHRAYHALPPLNLKKTGESVNAVFGFAQILLRVVNEQKPTCYAVTFDRKAPTFRHHLYEAYKAHRPPAPDDLVTQFQRVRQLVEAFNIPIFELDGFEADDLLGSLSRQARDLGIETIIVTGDADTMQLVNDRVKVLYPKPRRPFSDTMLFDEAAVQEKYGVAPSLIADLKALKGDPSDNIPGVAGIGEKTALNLVQKFGPVERIYEHIEEVSPPKLKENLRANEGIARQSKILATIDSMAPVILNMDSCQTSLFNRRQVADFFRELEFFTLLDRLPAESVSAEAREPVVTAEIAPPDYRMVIDSQALDTAIVRLRESGNFAFDTETTGLDAMTADLVGIGLSMARCQAFYIPVGHRPASGSDPTAQLPLEEVLGKIKPLLEDPAVAKIAHNAKYDMTILERNGVKVANLSFDTMVAAYLLGEKTLSLKGVAFNKLGVEMVPISDLIGTGAKQICIADVSAGKVSSYCCADSDITGQLKQILEPELRQRGLWSLFADIEMPLVPVLLDMEMNGILVDKTLLGGLSQELAGQLKNLEIEIYKCANQEFNINSSQQLSTLLYEKLGYPRPRKTQGGYTTEASALEDLQCPERPIIKLILEYRTLSKLKSTYIDALPGLVNSQTGRIHTSFNQTRTTTGRLSSTDPNLQNIPIRGELGKRIRQAFIAPPESVLIAGDYSQIDLRSLAHLSGDPALVNAFRNNEDIHTATGALLFNVLPSAVNPDMRRDAKTINFGVIYGMSEYGLQQATDFSREEAGMFIKAYFDKYPEVRHYLERTKEQARRDGFVETLLKRRRYIPEINSANRIVREAAERMAINMPVQGTSADIIKVAMVNLATAMHKLDLKSKMLLQVHDELIFEVPEEERNIMVNLIRDTMTSAVILSVPLKVDIKIGKNWGEMEA